jgi:hypothetical protein
MMAGKLPETANINGGVIANAQTVGGSRVDVTETVARAPSFYRALAVAGGNTYEEKTSIARATIGAKGSAVTGRLRIEAATDTAYPVVQKFTGTDGVESKRVSTNESTWGSWRKLFDEVDKPNIATDVTGAGTAAAQNVQNDGIAGTGVPTIDGDNTWNGDQYIHGRLRFAEEVVTIASGVADATLYNHLTLIGEGGGAAADDLVTVNNPTRGILLVVQRFSTAGTITLKDGTGNLRLAGDFALASNNDRIVLFGQGTTWIELCRSTNG